MHMKMLTPRRTRVWLGLLLSFVAPRCACFDQLYRALGAPERPPTRLSALRRSQPAFAVASREDDPRKLTVLLKDAASPRELFGLYADHSTTFNHIHISAIWISFSKLARGRGRPRKLEKEFGKLCLHTQDMASTGEMGSRGLSNCMYALAKAGIRGKDTPELLDALAAAGVSGVGDFEPQALSNSVWAFATAGHASPTLFDALAAASVSQIGDFNPQALSNTAWAFAKADHASPALFDALAVASVSRVGDFLPQALANTAWAFATAGHAPPALFDALAAAAATLLGDFDPQALAITAWAFATAGHATPALFDAAIAQRCEAGKATEARYGTRHLAQLHQWILWSAERDLPSGVSAAFSQRCRAAFVADSPSPSRLQREVVTTLAALGLSPREEVRTAEGYTIDAVVEWQGATVGIEVDGPSHFHGRAPTGATMLKRRQLATLGGWRLISVPYWEWASFRGDERRQQEYLHWALYAALRARVT